MEPVEIAKGIFDVGVRDWTIRDFHGYSTETGTTYNAYLIMDEKITLVDTVKKGFEDEMLERISHIIDPKKIDIVMRNVLYPALIYANPNRDVTTSQLMNFEEGRAWTTNDGQSQNVYTSREIKKTFMSVVWRMR